MSDVYYKINLIISCENITMVDHINSLIILC